MRKFLLPLAIIFVLCLGPGAFAQQTHGPAGKAGPQLSGFFDFSSFPADFPSGVGTIQRITCTVGSSDQPAIYSGNMLLDCDAETPHNETTIAVDPNDRNHAIGGYYPPPPTINPTPPVCRASARAPPPFPPSPFKNRVYVTWTPFSQFFSPTAASFHAQIAVSFSDDGANWSEPKTISGFSSACSAALFGLPNECDLDQDSYPTVAPTGRVYVSFENFNTPAENQAIIVSSTDVW